MNCKKSILSLVTILALNSSVMADPNASYVPLTNKTNDNAWVMFGVNGFGDGVSSVASSGVFTAGYATVAEASVSDDIASPSAALITAAAAGTIFNDSGTANMATFQALKDSAGTAYFTASVTMGIKTSDLTDSTTQPVRTMYIAVQTSATDTNTIAKIKLDYKANLEGRTAEIQLGGTGTVYKVTISETSTFSNPGIAKDVPAAVTTKLTKPEDTLAYDLAASPIIASAYSKATHQGTAIGSERFYHYDAANAVWILWDRAKVTAGSNTLTNFEKGKSYWGKMDINANGTTGSSTSSGLYLGTSGLSIADSAVYAGKLTSGSWNMLAFDPASHPDIRNSTTGLVFTTRAIVDNDAMTIVDETGVNSVVVTFSKAALVQSTVGTNDTELIAIFINEAIDAAKLLGKVPKSFNVRAFGMDAAATLALVSDKKFTLKDTTGDMIGAVATLANKNVVNAIGVLGAMADVGLGANDTATSVYGEYSMLIEPLVGANTAGQLDSVVTGTGAPLSAKVQFGDINGDSVNGSNVVTPLGLAANNTATTLTTAAAVLTADPVFTGKGRVLEIDTNFDGTNDMLLATATSPFYIKDHTYTRVYSIDSTTATGTPTATNANVAYNVKNTVSKTLTPANNDAAAAFVTAINAVADTNTPATDTKVYAAADGANLVVVTTDSPLMDLEDADSATSEYFTKASSTANIAKGAINQILDVSKLARQDVVTDKITVTFSADVPATAQDLGLSIDTMVSGVTIAPANTAVTAAVRTDTTILAMLDSLVSNLNTALKTAGSAAFASHNYVSGYNDITKAVITVEGIDINQTATVLVEANATALAAATAQANATAGKLSVSSAAIIGDLKDNAIYTPDYVNYGPLYTLKSAGYELKALLRASTKLAGTPTTHWDAIDLTRASKDWLKNNEFNLFSVDNTSGYWGYVTTYTNPNNISASNVVFTPSYAYHFNPVTNATDNIINTAAFSVDINGTTAATSSAKLIIAGSEIQLTSTGSTYTANINEYEAGLASNTAVTFGIKVADGLGERFDNLTLSTLDYVKPAVPTVTFTSAAQAILADTSTDVASYYLWANYIPDNGASVIAGPINTTAASSYNMCHATAYASSTPYKLVAVDGTGVFAKANISNADAFTFVNTIKDATVLTHSYGDSASTALRYDTTCIATTDTTKSGVEVRAQQVGTVRLAYQHATGTVNITTDLPVTSYYDIPTAVGTAVIQIDSLPSYAGNTFYVQYNNALYVGTFPATRAAGDGSFATPLNLTAVTSQSQRLD